jgi:modulator of FtsH protease
VPVSRAAACGGSWRASTRGSLIYSILGLVISAGLTTVDFQRLRRTQNLDSAPLIAASIFLDALNVCLFFLRIFGRGSD